MQANDRQEQISFLGSSSPEEAGEQPEEPDQRRLRLAQAQTLRHEEIRLAAIGAGMLLMFAAFALFLATTSALPLFAVIVVVYPLYRLLDRQLRNLKNQAKEKSDVYP